MRPSSIKVRPRDGTAIVAALALVTLAAALLAWSAAVVSAGARAVLAERAALSAESQARRLLAITLRHWDVRDDSLDTGAMVDRIVDAESSEAAPALPTTAHVSVQRLGATLFAIAADVRVGGDQPLARRRIRLLVQRVIMPDSVRTHLPPAPIARWSTADLY
jgi:hypothetical protein